MLDSVVLGKFHADFDGVLLIDGVNDHAALFAGRNGNEYGGGEEQ
jgi:hypothetical protein